MYDEKGLDENGHYRGYREDKQQILARDASGIPYWIVLEDGQIVEEIIGATTQTNPYPKTWRDRPPML